MGRFFNTSGANPLDYMYRLNTPLMEKVVETNDQYIDQNLQGLGKIDDLANYNHLMGDDEDAQKIISGYRNRVDDLTSAIQKDPANWRKQSGNIRDLTKALQTDYESGPISKQLYNYNQRKSAFDAIDKQVELYHTSGGEKGVDPTRAAAYKQYYDSQFDKTAYDPTTGKYNVYKGGTVMDNMNVKKILSDGLDKIKADKSFQYHTDEAGNGWFFNKETNKVEQVTPERVLGIAMSNVTPQMMEYLKQDSNVGLVRGVYDDKGNFIQPYSYSEVGLAPEEQASIQVAQKKIDGTKDPKIKEYLQNALNTQVSQLQSRRQLKMNDQSYFAPILKGLIGTYAYRDSEEGNTLTNNNRGATIYREGMANARQAATLSQQYKMHTEREAAIQKRFQDRLDFDKYKFDHPQTKPTGLKGSGTKQKAIVNTPINPQETTVSKIATNSFEDWKTFDPKAGKEVPVLSIAGLSADIDTKKTSIEQTDARLKDINNQLAHSVLTNDAMNALKLERSQLQFKRDNLAKELNDRRTWYNVSSNAALSNHPAAGTNFTKDQVNLYNEFKDDRDGNKFDKTVIQPLISQLQAANKERVDMSGTHSVGEQQERMLEHNNKIKALKEQLDQARNKRSTYLNIRDKVNNGRDKFLQGMRNDTIDSDAIQLGEKDSKDVSDMLLNNTQDYKIYDAFGKSTGGIQLEGKGVSWWHPTKDNFNLTFDGGSLPQYIRENNVKVRVNKLANTTKMGNGNAIVEVTFDDPNGEIPKNTPYYIELNPQAQKDIATKFTSSKDPDVAAVANQILDDEGNAIRRQLMRPTANRTLGVDDQPEPGNFNIFVTSNDGRKIPLKVTTFSDGGTNHLHVTMTDKDGNEVPFAKKLPDGTYQSFRQGGLPGFFNGIEDFVQQYRIGKYGESNKK